MDFFKSVFSTDPEPSDPLTESLSPSDSPRDRHNEGCYHEQEEDATSKNHNSPSLGGGDGGGEGGGLWSFGGLIKTISSKSESVIQTYRRDLEEFSTGLKKETSVFKEVATRAVRDLPGSLEVGASVAQESLESVGQAIDEIGGTVWRGTSVIISQGKEAILSMDSDSNSPSEGSLQAVSSTPMRYNRFEAQVLGIQNDASTFVEEPDDGVDFAKWMSEFKLAEKDDEIEGLLYENETLEGVFEKFVPEIVDKETFWSRYFYRVHRLKQAEDARAKLVKRAILGEEEEELSWEVDEDDYNEVETNTMEFKATNEKKKEDGEKGITREIVGTSKSIEDKAVEDAAEEFVDKIVKTSEVPKDVVALKEAAEGSESAENKKSAEASQVETIVETSEVPKDEVALMEAAEASESAEDKKSTEASHVENVEAKVELMGSDALDSKPDDKMPPEPKSEPGESGKDSDFSVVSSQPSLLEEDDLGWDEIADLGEHDDKKVSSGSPKRLDLLKRPTIADDDEDLSWDIEEEEEEEEEEEHVKP